MKVPGYELVLGREVPPPRPVGTSETTWSPDWTMDWCDAIEQAIRDDDAWGVIVQRPNMDVKLYDVHSTELAVCGGGTAWLVVGRERS